MIFFPAPPPAIAPAPQTLPPLSFAGFRAGMPLPEATSRIKAAGGALRCKPTSDRRMRDCTGTLPSGAPTAFAVLISSIHDSAAVMVLSTSSNTRTAAAWVKALTERFGRPNREGQPNVQASWQWIRAGRMLRVVERKRGPRWEASVTLTHGPLLDGLGKP